MDAGAMLRQLTWGRSFRSLKISGATGTSGCLAVVPIWGLGFAFRA